jgi:chitin synthase
MDYFFTINANQGNIGPFMSLNSNILDILQQQLGQDITKPLNAVLAKLNTMMAQ